MTYEMTIVKLEGFTHQYGLDVVQHLNEVINRLSLCNHDLEQIGKGVNGYVSHAIHGTTEDDYTWFGRLYFNRRGARVAVLFPWHQDFDHPVTRMDRSINIYASEKMPEKDIEGLAEELGLQATLYRNIWEIC
ncbi:hypothetical protein J4210_05300 [Candidatus Woesearchaeota archaeon]|nr:hypothetical protein [Candidatus Woesearchaeota archaeon]